MKFRKFLVVFAVALAVLGVATAPTVADIVKPMCAGDDLGCPDYK